MTSRSSPDDLPRITKRELARVGIELLFEHNVRDWMRRGWMEMQLYLWNQGRFGEYERVKEIHRDRLDAPPIVTERLFEEDGA